MKGEKDTKKGGEKSFERIVGQKKSQLYSRLHSWGVHNSTCAITAARIVVRTPLMKPIMKFTKGGYIGEKRIRRRDKTTGERRNEKIPAGNKTLVDSSYSGRVVLDCYYNFNFKALRDYLTTSATMEIIMAITAKTKFTQNPSQNRLLSVRRKYKTPFPLGDIS